MPEMGYAVALTAGAHTWNVTNTSPPGFGLADPLVISWRQAAAPRPGQPEAMVCEFSVSTPDVSTLADVVVGTAVDVSVTFTWDGLGEGFPVRFAGVVAAADAVNVDRGDGAMIVTYTCVDRTGDLLEAVTDVQDHAVVLAHEAAIRALYDGAFGAGAYNAEVVRPTGFASATTRVLTQRDGQVLWDGWLELLDLYAYDTTLMGFTSDEPFARLILDPYPPALAPLKWELAPVPEAWTPRDGVGLPFTVLAVPGTWVPENLLSADAAKFEGGLGAWTGTGTPAPTLAQTTARAHDGTHSMLVTWNGSGTFPQAQITGTLTASVQYTVRAWVYVPTGSPDVRLVGSSTVGSLSAVKDQWHQLSLTFTQGASTTVTIAVRSPATPGTCYVDGVELFYGAPPVNPDILYGVLVKPPDPEAGVLDACYIDFASAWSLTKPRVTNRAVVGYLLGTGVVDGVTGEVDPGVPRQVVRNRSAGKPIVTESRDTTLYQIAADGTSADMAGQVASLIIPPSSDTNGWAPEAFRWHLWKDPAGCRSFPLLFPDQTAPSKHRDRVDAYVRPIAVAGIPAHLNPAASGGAVVGQLGSVTLTLEGGGAVVDIVLNPGTPAAGEYVPGDSVRWDGVDPGLTWNGVAPTVTWNDYLAVSHWTWNDFGDYYPNATWDQLVTTDTWNMYGLAGP